MKPTFNTIEKRVTAIEAARRPTTSPATLARTLVALSALRARVASGYAFSADDETRLARINELLNRARARRDLAMQTK